MSQIGPVSPELCALEFEKMQYFTLFTHYHPHFFSNLDQIWSQYVCWHNVSDESDFDQDWVDKSRLKCP